jgi:hypothetical protein
MLNSTKLNQLLSPAPCSSIPVAAPPDPCFLCVVLTPDCETASPHLVFHGRFGHISVPENGPSTHIPRKPSQLVCVMNTMDHELLLADPDTRVANRSEAYKPLYERVATFLYPVSVKRLVLKTWYSKPVLETWDSEPVVQTWDSEPALQPMPHHQRQDSVICETMRNDDRYAPLPFRRMASAYPSPPPDDGAFLPQTIDPALLDKVVESQYQPPYTFGLRSPGTQTESNLPFSLIDPLLENWNMDMQTQSQLAFEFPSTGIETDFPLSLIDPSLENWSMDMGNQAQFTFRLPSPGTERDYNCLDECPGVDP